MDDPNVRGARPWLSITRLSDLRMGFAPPAPGEFCITLLMQPAPPDEKLHCSAWIGMADSADSATGLWIENSGLTPEEFGERGYECFTFTVDPEVLGAAALLVRQHRAAQAAGAEG